MKQLVLVGCVLMLMVGCGATEASVVSESGAAIPEEAGSLTGDAARGEALFSEEGCLACHAVEPGPERVGPTMVGLVERSNALIQDPSYTGAATSVEDYIHEAIVNPQVYINAGYAPVMSPTLTENLSRQDLADLVAYLLEFDE